MTNRCLHQSATILYASHTAAGQKNGDVLTFAGGAKDDDSMGDGIVAYKWVSDLDGGLSTQKRSAFPAASLSVGRTPSPSAPAMPKATGRQKIGHRHGRREHLPRLHTNGRRLSLTREQFLLTWGWLAQGQLAIPTVTSCRFERVELSSPSSSTPPDTLADFILQLNRSRCKSKSASYQNSEVVHSTATELPQNTNVCRWSFMLLWWWQTYWYRTYLVYLL